MLSQYLKVVGEVMCCHAQSLRIRVHFNYAMIKQDEHTWGKSTPQSTGGAL